MEFFVFFTGLLILGSLVFLVWIFKALFLGIFVFLIGFTSLFIESGPRTYHRHYHHED